MSEQLQLHWREIDSKTVNVGNVHIVDRIIYPTKARIDAMAKSLSGPLGQLQPILVTKYLHSAWKVVAGATRLLAAKDLGWKQIRATIISADNDIEYQLIEIAENLDRHDLSDGERTRLKNKNKELRAQQLEEFERELAENETPVKAKGGRGKKGGVADAARKAGVSETTARRKARQNEKRRGLDEATASKVPDRPTSTNPEPPKPPKPPKPELTKCPLCHGKGMVPSVDAEAGVSLIHDILKDK